MVPVSLGLNMSFANVEESRGTGTVGGTTDGKNVWRYENLYVLMTTSDKLLKTRMQSGAFQPIH